AVEAASTAPPAQAMPGGPAGHPGHGGTTASGLARRIRGRNMPATQPHRITRGGDPPVGALPSGQLHSPTDVYGFLTSFTSGVQRGLDEAQRRALDEAQRRAGRPDGA
ncbi:MAG TPA: hypothetical protein VF743_10520, partial [Acidimicrobiales bacterium]